MAVDNVPPPPGDRLLPVGGYAVAMGYRSVSVQVQVDQNASATSDAAQILTGYAVDNLITALPEDSAQSYAVSIANCVNAAYDLWNKLNQQPPPSMTGLMETALQDYAACRDLQDKLAKDHDEQVAAAAQADERDLSDVADTAGQGDWESRFEKVDDVPEIHVAG